MEDVSFFQEMKDKYWDGRFQEILRQNLYVWLDGFANYISAIGYPNDEKKFKKILAGRFTLHRKGYCKISCYILASHAFVGKIRSAQSIFIHGFNKCCGSENVKSLGNVMSI